ncbi:MAG: stage III sporulation protein AB [Clostridiales bacterium]|nr:stage III sporulation protein AB [Clostridiales bacterium]
MNDTALEQAAACLPRELRLAALAKGERGRYEEIRLRAGRGMFLTGADGREEQVLLGGEALPVSADDLSLVVELATRASYQSAAEKLKSGFLPLKGGHRLGLCGTVTVREGSITGFRELSSLAIRIARPVNGFAEPVVAQVYQGERPSSTLILSPPGYGKTTLLRDLVRLISLRCHLRIGLADERGEVAALWKGVPQLDVGPTTDVLDGCPKAQGLMQLLRGMGPQLLAADEITAPEDVAALSSAANCGVAVLATAHAAGVEELEQRPLYRELLEQGIFQQVCILRREGQRRSCAVEALPCKS